MPSQLATTRPRQRVSERRVPLPPRSAPARNLTAKETMAGAAKAQAKAAAAMNAAVMGAVVAEEATRLRKFRRCVTSVSIAVATVNLTKPTRFVTS